MMIDSRLLRVFKAVAQELHFGRAAQRLHMSQPPLSQSIRQLEEILNVPLFVRTTRQVQLTAAGAELLQHLPAIEAAHERAVEAMQHMARGVNGSLAVALTPSAAFTPIPQVLRGFRKQFPHVQLSFREMNSRDMHQALLAGSVDLALGRLLAQSEGLTCRTIYQEPLYLSVPKEHHLAHRCSVTLAEALETELIGYCPKDSVYFHTLLTRLAQQYGTPAKTQLVSNIPTLLLLVECGMGTAIVPHSLTRLRGDTLAHLSIAGIDDVRADLSAMYRTSDTSALLERFLLMLRTQLE